MCEVTRTVAPSAASREDLVLEYRARERIEAGGRLVEHEDAPGGRGAPAHALTFCRVPPDSTRSGLSSWSIEPEPPDQSSSSIASTGPRRSRTMSNSSGGGQVLGKARDLRHVADPAR